MEAKTTIKGLFANRDRHFVIPPYQRAYSWEIDKNLKIFLNDLLNQPPQKSYFLGHFLFEQSDDKKERYSIIDGQQRLTTTVIFFSCILRILEKRNDISEDLNLERSKEFYIKDGHIIKLKTVDYDNNFFQNLIINDLDIKQPRDTSSQERIFKAKTYFNQELSQLPSTKLCELIDILEKADITTFVVESKEQAAQIFGFQNDRGKELTDLERIKSHIMYLIYLYSSNTEEDIKFVEREFVSIYLLTEKISIHEDEILNYHCRALYFGFTDENVVEKIKQKLKSMNKSKRVDWIHSFCTELKSSFRYIEVIIQSKNKYLKDLFYLNRMAICYPFLLKGYRFISDEANLERLFRLLENIVFRVKLISSRANIETRLNESLKSFKGDIDSLIQKIREEFASSSWWYAYWGDSKVKETINSGWFYGNSVDNYLLWKYEESFKGKGYGNIPFNSVNQEQIEHISPQTPSGDEPLAHGYDEYTEEFKNKWLNCLGNLMLISKSNNCELGNKPFEVKLRSYESNTALSQHLEIKKFLENQKRPIWDKKGIKKRHKKIVEFATDYWSLDNL